MKYDFDDIQALEAAANEIDSNMDASTKQRAWGVLLAQSLTDEERLAALQDVFKAKRFDN